MHYEELRRRVSTGRAFGSRLGLSLLLRSGMVAWMEGWAACAPVEAAAPAVEVTSEPLPDERCAEVVSVLCSMALSHLIEATA